jgi:hypothetical protein
MTRGVVKTVVNVEEMRLSNTTENSFGNFTELRYRKINRTHHALLGFFGVRRNIVQETGFLVFDLQQKLQQKLY